MGSTLSANVLPGSPDDRRRKGLRWFLTKESTESVEPMLPTLPSDVL